MGEIQKLGKSEREKQVKEVACVVAVKAGKILMGKRADVQKWCMPGGHLEPGEGAQEGALRELHEEAGLEGKDVTYLGHSFAGRSQNIKVRVFVATVTGEPTAENDPDEEFDEFRWVNPYELPDAVKDNLYNKQDVALQFLGAQEESGKLVWGEERLAKSDLMSLIARTKALSQHMRQLADRGPMSYVFPHPHGGTVVVSPDPSKQGKWRATRIGADRQPTGHVEADDHHGAIRHAHSYGADVMNPVQPAMQKFEEDLGIWLAKATRPENFKAIVRALSNEGRRFVDHASQLHAHPPKLHPEVEHYNNEVLSSAKIHKPKSGNLKEGITRKLIYHTEHQPSELGSPSPHGHQRSFMVKPYHEGVIKRTHGWAKFPIQGWAEMTNQALYHAAGMGDRHQRVHVAEHNMGPGHEKEPALVVHMEKGMNPIDTHDAENIYVEPGSPMSQEGAKIVAMDFLTNNLDRHAGNLLVSTKKDAGPGEGLPNWVHREMARTMRYPSWLTDEIGAVNHVDNLMAIDHSRSFQYLNNHAYKWDTPKSVRKRELTDKLRYYFFGTAASRPATARLWEQPRTHEEKIDFIEKVGVPLATWWGDYQDGIREAFYGQLEHIKDPEAKAHLRRNFDARADHLTDLWRQGVENHGVDWFDSEVPIYQPGQKSWREEEEEKNSGEKP